MDADNATHEGIRTVDKEKVSKLSTNSELRVCVVTWNMNGKVKRGFCVHATLLFLLNMYILFNGCSFFLVKVPLQYIGELVTGAEKCDLLIIGLQEAPRGNIAQLFQQILSETHRYLMHFQREFIIQYFSDVILTCAHLNPKKPAWRINNAVSTAIRLWS